MSTLKGLPVSVYKSSNGDCSNNGLSSKENSLILVGSLSNIGAFEILIGSLSNIGPFEVQEGQDCLVAVYRERFDDIIAVPKSLLDKRSSYMFGGNFAYSSDSRFPSKNPIKIFDRVEK